MSRAYHPADFEQRWHLRITRAGALFILGACVVTHLMAALGAVAVKSHFDRREAQRAAEAPKPASVQPEFAATYLDCAPLELQRAKEHLYACYRRELSSRIKR